MCPLPHRRIGLSLLPPLLLALAAGVARAQTPASPPLELIARLQLPASGAKLWAHKNTVYVGNYTNAKLGVQIVDISDPARPQFLGSLPRRLKSSVEYEDVSVVAAETPSFKGDLLTVGYQGGPNGVEFWDVTDPRQPKLLSFISTPTWVHELWAFQRDGRVFVLVANWTEGMRVIEATDPTQPQVIGHWEIGRELNIMPTIGTWAGAFNHSVSASADGKTAYVSYWDAGTVILDISDPTKPVYLGRTAPVPGDEGNQRSSLEADEGRLLVTTEADVDPEPVSFLVRVLAPASMTGPLNAMELSATRQLVNTGPVRGEVVYVGKGSPGTELLADPKGKIALLDDRLAQSVLRMQEAGAVGVLSSPIAARSGRPRSEITIPGMSIAKEAGDALKVALAAGERVEVELVPGTPSLGVVRLWDIRDRTKPVQVGTFATPSSRQYPRPDRAHHWAPYAFARGDRVYASWGADGVRVIDIRDPAQPKEMAHFVPPYDPSAPNCQGGSCGPWTFVWEAIEHNGLVLALDVRSGLYILRDVAR